ncbi:MAG: hypothetical protein NUV86_02805 [Candidatus Scalindua sp.]|nr:hypothetical protein [Candidatus Scalindua sp.]MCR4344021.1 hypothetical protein [Candidatus Scalindua sp.]
MIIGECGKIKSIPFKYILIFVGLVVCAGLIFRFGFMKIFHNMNKNHVYRKPEIVEEKSEPQLEPVELEKENKSMYTIVGIIDGHYIIKTRKGFKKPKVLN